MNRLTSGVARFNYEFAEQLNIPNIQMFSSDVGQFKSPMFSFKADELNQTETDQLVDLIEANHANWSLSVFFHLFSGSQIEWFLVERARTVYCGNAEIAAMVRTRRADGIVIAWCPGVFLEAIRFKPVDISILSFGMAHKIRVRHYTKLYELLEKSNRSYCIYLSTALHDGTSFDDEFASAYYELRSIFGDRLYFMGYLSDVAIYNYIKDVTFYVAFFDRGVRSNNTTVHVAMQLGATTITNLDAFSPPQYQHEVNLFDIHQLDEIPTDPTLISTVGQRATLVQQQLGWKNLVELVREHNTQRD